jgi:hypothetical protein
MEVVLRPKSYSIFTTVTLLYYLYLANASLQMVRGWVIYLHLIQWNF